ncbi:MAG: PilZ domain-containing protein [Spirochaetota bacterium]|nr:PilZ domain-containing protein [Spirochaetota bacterium]
MGEKVGRIEKEFVLSVLSENKMPLDIHGTDYQVKGHAVEGDEEVITVQCDTNEGKLFFRNEPVRVYFSYYGHTMMFETTVLEPGETITLAIPPGLVKNLERKYERIPTPQGLSMSFVFEDVAVQLSFPESREYRKVDEQLFSDYFQGKEIQDLLRQFKEKALEFAELNSIVMLRNRTPQNLEEKIMTETGKSIFIPQVSRGLPADSDYPQQPVITAELFPDPKERDGAYLGLNRDEAHEHFMKKAEKGIFSELYCPIIYLQYVVGYIYLANTVKRKRPFALNILDFALEFSYVLAFSLKESGYFYPNKREKKNFHAEIINVSASGILFSYPSGELSNEIRIYTDLDLVLNIGKRSVKVLGRVMRRYETAGMTFFGVQFMEMQPEDFRFLFDQIYGRPFTEKDDAYWEGGAAPPKIEF